MAQPRSDWIEKRLNLYASMWVGIQLPIQIQWRKSIIGYWDWCSCWWLASGITTYAVTGNMDAAVDGAAYGAIGGAAAVGSFLVAPATLAGTAAAVVF